MIFIDYRTTHAICQTSFISWISFDMANQFKRGQAVRFETVGAGVRVKRRGTVVRTYETARGKRVEIKTSQGDRFKPHLSLVRASA